MIWLNRIILLFTCIFEIFILYDFFSSFFELRKMLYNSALYRTVVIIAISLTYIVNSQNNAYVNLIIVPIIYFLYIFICFQGNTWIKIIYFIVAYILLLGCEFLFVVLLSIPTYFLKKSSVVDLSTMPWQILSLKLLTYILFTIAKRIPKGTKRRMDFKTFCMYLFVPISSMGIMLTTYYSGMDLSGKIGLQCIMVACYTMLLLGSILAFYAFNRYSEQLEKGMEQEMIISKQNLDLKYFNQVEALNDKYKEFIHNTTHYLKAIGQLAKDRNGNEILDILEELHIELEKNETIIFCVNHTINAVLSEKRIQAENSQVIYDVYIEQNIDFSGITSSDIIIMLGNLLDNAIIAASKCKSERKVTVRIYKNNEKTFNIVKIVNDFSEELQEDNGKFITTKRNKALHGIGIQSVKNTAKKYGGYLEYIIDGWKCTAVLVLSTLR